MSFAAKKSSGAGALTITGRNVSGSGSAFTACGNVATGDGGGVGTPNIVVTDGSGSYTYSWALLGSPATYGPYPVYSATSQNPYWSDAVCDNAGVDSETWRVTVTDTATGVTGTYDVDVLLSWVNLS